MDDQKRFYEWDKTYLKIAQNIASMSHAIRRKVGAIIVRDGSILGFGYNGMPKGMSNICENDCNETKPEVLHAETNAITKIAKSNESTENTTLYVTLSPCLDCAKLISQSGITRVVYKEEYRNTDGLTYLVSLGIKVEQIL